MRLRRTTSEPPTIEPVTSDEYRWQAGTGAVVGALVADAVASGSATWTEGALRSIDIAESMLTGSPAPIDLQPHDAVAAAIGLSDGPGPLLVDPTTVELVDAVRHVLDKGSAYDLRDSVLVKAAELARANTFVDAVQLAGEDAEFARLVGALAGLEGGLGAIPARLVSTMQSSGNRKGRRYLGGLTNRLLGIERPQWYDARRRRGPAEVLPGLWVSNLLSVQRFTSAHPVGLVLSLCDDEGRFENHPHHVTFHLEDTPRTDANPSLEIVIDDVLGEIAAARAAGQPVLVHCRHGASRTGLILRLLLVEELGLSADDAFTEAQCLWSHTSSWNKDWTRLVESRA